MNKYLRDTSSLSCGATVRAGDYLTPSHLADCGMSGEEGLIVVDTPDGCENCGCRQGCNLRAHFPMRLCGDWQAK